MSAPIIELRDVSKHFGEGDARVDALRHVSLTVMPGEVVYAARTIRFRARRRRSTSSAASSNRRATG